jgi:hypothetical protein
MNEKNKLSMLDNIMQRRINAYDDIKKCNDINFLKIIIKKLEKKVVKNVNYVILINYVLERIYNLENNIIEQSQQDNYTSFSFCLFPERYQPSGSYNPPNMDRIISRSY